MRMHYITPMNSTFVLHDISIDAYMQSIVGLLLRGMLIRQYQFGPGRSQVFALLHLKQHDTFAVEGAWKQEIRNLQTPQNYRESQLTIPHIGCDLYSEDSST